MRSVKFYLLSACVLLSGVVVGKEKEAETGHEWKSAKSGGYSYKYVSNDPMQARFYTLGNGLTVILSPTHKEPRMHFYIATKAGSKTDPADMAGML